MCSMGRKVSAGRARGLGLEFWNLPEQAPGSLLFLSFPWVVDLGMRIEGWPWGIAQQLVSGKSGP